MVVEMEQMASRPFASCNLEIVDSPTESLLQKNKEPPDLQGSRRIKAKVSHLKTSEMTQYTSKRPLSNAHLPMTYLAMVP